MVLTPIKRQAAAIGYLLHKFVEEARRDSQERKRRLQIAWLELQLLRYEVGTELYEATKKKIVDSAGCCPSIGSGARRQ